MTIAAIVGLAGVGVFLGGCGSLPGNAAEPIEQEPVAVRAVAASRGDVARTLSFSARIEPQARVDLVAEVAGRIEDVVVSEGQRVETGDRLLTIESEYLRIGVRQARAQMDSALAGLEDARRAHTIARREIERLEPLYRAGAVAQQTWDRALDDLETARRAAEVSAPAAVSGARAALDAAERQLADAGVTAPIAGDVAAVAVSAGQQVGTGTHLVTITDRDRVEVVGLVSERQVVQVEVGMSARVRPGALEDREMTTSIAQISSVAAPSGAGYPVRLFLDNPDGALRPGMVAEVSVEVERIRDAVLVPVDALVDRGEGPAVFLLDDGDVVSLRSVVTGLSDGAFVEVREGLGAGDRVVVTGQSYLADGVSVRVVGEGGTS